MGRLFVFTLGFTESFALRRFTALSAGSGDGFICFTVKPVVPAVTNAYQSLVAYANRLGVTPLGLLDIDVSVVPDAIYSIVNNIVGALRSSGFDTVVLDVSGGMRPLVVSATLAAMVLSRLTNVIFYVSGEGGESIEYKLGSTDFNVLSLPQVSSEDRRILGVLLENEGLNVDGIAGKLGLSAKTVANRLSLLQRMGLIYRRGRGSGAYITGWGRLLWFIEELKASKGIASGTSSTYT